MSWNSIFMDGVWWVGMSLTWNMKGIGFKGWPNEYILAWCVLLDCMIMFGLCQCVIFGVSRWDFQGCTSVVGT